MKKVKETALCSLKLIIAGSDAEFKHSVINVVNSYLSLLFSFTLGGSPYRSGVGLWLQKVKFALWESQRYRWGERNLGGERERVGKRVEPGKLMYVKATECFTIPTAVTDWRHVSIPEERVWKLLSGGGWTMFLILGPNHSTDKKMFQASSGNMKQKCLCVCCRDKRVSRGERDNESIVAACIYDIQANLVVSHSPFTICDRLHLICCICAHLCYK